MLWRKVSQKFFKSRYEAELCTGLAHNFVSVCSWIPETRFQNIFNSIGKIKEKERTKERTKGASLLRDPLTIHKIQSLALAS